MKRTVQLAARRGVARSALLVVIGGFVASSWGCGDDLLRRRVEVPEPSGADPELRERFGITDDAQDPTERDTELGYGRWKEAPETEGTKDPFSPSRRNDPRN